MLRQSSLIAASLAAVIAFFLYRWSAQESLPPAPLVTGRNNTVLFITDVAQGLSNVHIATSYALLEHHPAVEVHYASFPRLKDDLQGVSIAATKKSPGRRPIIWHELPSADYVAAAMRSWGDIEGVVGRPGVAGINKMVRDMELTMSPWEADEHLQIYETICDLIREVDPAVVVLDALLHPAMDAARNMHRAHAVISPNAMPDLLMAQQPWAGMFWKYPALGSGFKFPLPWHQIPSNIYIILRVIFAVMKSSSVTAKREFLTENGVNDPLKFFEIHHKSVPWLLTALPEASIPVDFVPDHVKCCGPIVRDVAPVHEQDPGFAAWLRRAPTMLVNLGSQMKYNEKRATAMAKAFLPVLEHTQTQILWKFQKIEHYDDTFLVPVERYIKNGRLRLEKWLAVDPTSILRSGHVTVSVHHGGANCYHETIL